MRGKAGDGGGEWDGEVSLLGIGTMFRVIRRGWGGVMVGEWDTNAGLGDTGVAWTKMGCLLVGECAAAALGVGSGCGVDGDGQRRESEVRVWGVVDGDWVAARLGGGMDGGCRGVGRWVGDEGNGGGGAGRGGKDGSESATALGLAESTTRCSAAADKGGRAAEEICFFSPAEGICGIVEKGEIKPAWPRWASSGF